MKTAMALALLLALSAVGCRDARKASIEAFLREGEAAVEAGDRAALERLVALDYGDPYGEDRAAVVRRVLRLHRRAKNLDVEVRDVDIDLPDDEAAPVRVTLRVILHGEGIEHTAEAEALASHRRIRLLLRHEGSAWVVQRAQIAYSLFK